MKVLEINVRNVMNWIKFLTFLFHWFEYSIQCTKIWQILITLFVHQIVKILVSNLMSLMDKWLVYHLVIVQHILGKQPFHVEKLVEL